MQRTLNPMARAAIDNDAFELFIYITPLTKLLMLPFMSLDQ